VSDKEDRNRRDYDELKAKLGLKAEKKPASVSDKTPPGGFDLGLERGASELEEQPAVDAIKGVVAGDEAVVRSGGSRFLTFMLVFVGMALAGAVGYWVNKTQDNRLIADKQTQDASSLLNNVQGLAVTGGTCTAISTPCDTHGDCGDGYCLDGSCNDLTHGVGFCEDKNACAEKCPEGMACECTNRMDAAIYRYVHSIQKTHRSAEAMMSRMRNKDTITDVQYKALDSSLQTLQAESAAYVKKQPRIFAKTFLSDAVFNGEAVKVVVQLAASMDVLFNAAQVMANEDIVFKQFQTIFDPTRVEAPTRMKEWKIATIADKEGRPFAFLAGISLRRNKEGKVIIRAVEASGGRRSSSARKRYEAAFEYQEDRFKKAAGCDKPENKELCSWSPTDLVVEWDLKDDLRASLREEVTKHHDGYRKLLRFRLMTRVGQLEEAASPLLRFQADGREGGVWLDTQSKLAKFADQ